MKRILEFIAKEDWESLMEICPFDPEGQKWIITDFIVYRDKFESRNTLIKQVVELLLKELE